MTKKRFTTNGYKIYDTFHDGIHWLVNQVEANEIVDKMNNLDSKARERSKALSKLQKENEQLKQFKEKVFSLIEDELDEHPYLTLTEKWNPNCKNYHSCRGNHEKNVFYASRHTLLEKLREELSYD